jgi:hypothetical protein
MVLSSQLRIAQTYASWIDQPCMHRFFALPTIISFVVMGADCAYICANAPSPSQPTYARIHNTYANRYRSRHGKEVDRLSVLSVLKTLQGHPEVGTLWENLINKFLDDLDIVFITNKRSVYRGKIDGKVVRLYQQVDDIAAACSDPKVAQGWRVLVAAMQVAKIANYLRTIFVDLGFSPSGPTLPFEDIKAAINMAFGKERVGKPHAPLSVLPWTSR